ncbi:MAG: hypothetical protein ACXWUG_17320 [Polyangiales bacterium]
MRRFWPMVLMAVACSSSKSSSAHLDVVNDAKQQATFVYGKSTDDSIAWNTFVKGANQKVIDSGQTVNLAVPPAGHYRWGALELLEDPKMPGYASHQLVYESSFDSDGTTAISLHIPGDTGSPDGGTTDGGTGEGGVGKLCSKASDCTSGFCVNELCACDSAGHSKCPCNSKGASCADDGECCSLSCGFNTDGVCD